MREVTKQEIAKQEVAKQKRGVTKQEIAKQEVAKQNKTKDRQGVEAELNGVWHERHSNKYHAGIDVLCYSRKICQFEFV